MQKAGITEFFLSLLATTSFLAAAAVAVYGIAGLVSAWNAPPPKGLRLPSAETASPPAAPATMPDAQAARPTWPPLFGTPDPPPPPAASEATPPEPAPPPQADPVPEDPPFPVSDFVLRGIVTGAGGDGNWALIEVGAETRLFRVGDRIGDRIGDGGEIVAIGRHAVEIRAHGVRYRLEFPPGPQGFDGG